MIWARVARAYLDDFGDFGALCGSLPPRGPIFMKIYIFPIQFHNFYMILGRLRGVLKLQCGALGAHFRAFSSIFQCFAWIFRRRGIDFMKIHIFSSVSLREMYKSTGFKRNLYTPDPAASVFRRPAGGPAAPKARPYIVSNFRANGIFYSSKIFGATMGEFRIP